MPRPAPDLEGRRDRLVQAARTLAEQHGWETVTVRRVAHEIGATQPVVYSVFSSRQALVDAVAVDGFDELAHALQAVPAVLAARLHAYLEFAASNPRTYEAMFSTPSGLPFATGGAPPPLRAAFAAVRDVVPGGDDTRAEVAWALMHGLASLTLAGRLRGGAEEARTEQAARMVATEPGPTTT